MRSRPWSPHPKLLAEIGEDPARFLDPRTDLDPRPRIRGISDPETAAAWLAVARELERDGLVDVLEDKRDALVDRQPGPVATDGGEY
jgi:hypothetical protein